MATWKISTVSTTYPNVCSIAQSKNTGQYMLAVVSATPGTDLKNRIFKSNNYGETWDLLQNLFEIPTNGATDSSHLNYAVMETGAYDQNKHDSCTFYACAISDDGKYQSFGQKSGAALQRGIWYSTNYGKQELGATADEKWKYIKYSSGVRINPTTNSTNTETFTNGVIQMMYSPGAYPVYFSDYVLFKTYSHLTGLTPATGTATPLGNHIGNYCTSTVPALYDTSFTTIALRVVYYISGGNLYKNTNGGAGVNINPTGWQVSIPGGGVAVSSNSNIVVAAKYANSLGGLWLSNNGGSDWTQKLVNTNLNTVAMSNDGKYIITGPMGGGNHTFYRSEDYGDSWTPNVLSVTGNLLKLNITNNGKRVVGAGVKSRDPEWEQPSTSGYVNYIGPDTDPPSMTITSSTVANNAATNNASIQLIFTSNEATTDFSNNDISFNNGSFPYTLITSDNKVYTATIAPIEGVNTIYVPEGAFNDAAGNSNTVSNTFTFTYDNLGPTMDISSSNVTNGSITNISPIQLKFISSEPTIDFSSNDISFNNGAFPYQLNTIDNKVYTATINQPSQGVNTIYVPAGSYVDAAGNNNIASNIFTFTYDNLGPNMDISSSNVTNGSITKTSPIELKFISSEATTDFSNNDISFNNGAFPYTLIASGDNKVYTAMIDPPVQGVNTFYVPAGAYIDSAGNSNIASNIFTFTYDNLGPNMDISSSNVANGSITNNASIEIKFISSEPTTDFSNNDISFNNGAFPYRLDKSGDNRVYTATINQPSQGVNTIYVPAGAYIDSAGNSNIASNIFTFTFDNGRPSMTITSSTLGVTSGSTTNNATIALTFTSTESTNNFAKQDIIVTNGALGNLDTSDNIAYTATFTPTGPGPCTIDVSGGVYTDEANNLNNLAPTFKWTFARTVSFDTNTLTITNSIAANATDPVIFVLPSGEPMFMLNVTAFTGTGSGTDKITYDLTTGGTSVSSGTFTGTGTNLLAANPLIASTNTTYILTLISNAAITYTIVGTKVVDYANVTPSAVSFVANTLTIQNSIESTDVDKVSFDVTAGSRLYSLTVTSLLNSNSISYVLAISGGSTISSGSFTQSGADLLNGETFEQSTNTTYILTLTCSGNNTYSIAGRRLAAGYTVGDEIAAGLIPYFGADPSSNRLKQSYVKDFIDISGSLLLRNNANLYVEGNTTVKGKLMLNNTNLQTDLSFNRRILVGGDMSMNGNATIANDVSLNGSVLGCIFNNNSIPTSAFVSTVTAPSPDYTKASVIYQQKFRANGDVSMNGSTVQATNMTVNGNIEFNDGTKMTTYDDNSEVNYGTPFSIKKTNSIVGTDTNSGNGVQNKKIRCSLDGKYVAFSYGGGIVNSTGNTAAATGIDISQDYGMTFTRKYITIPGTETPIYRPYPIIVMSNDGKYMLTLAYGLYTASQPHKVSTNVIGLSSDYGTTWSSVYLNTIFNIAADTVAFVTDMAISTSPVRILIVGAITGSETGRTMVNTNISLTGFTQFATALNLSQLSGQLRFIGDRIININSGANDIDIYTLTGTRLTILNRAIGNYGDYSMWLYCSTSTVFVTGVVASNAERVVYRIDNLQTTSPSYTKITTLPTLPAGTGYSSCVSENGRYVLIGGAAASNAAAPILGPRTNFTFTSASDNRLLLSSDYGMTFTSIPPIYTVETYGSVTITDTGRVYILDTNTKANGITTATATLFKASTFSGLTIKGTLTAGTFVPPSDYRIKTNVAKLDNTFTIDNLRPVKYFQTLLNKKQYGLIAHELQQYYPDLVIGEKDAPDLQRVNYTGLIAILINEIIRLEREFTELENRRLITRG